VSYILIQRPEGHPVNTNETSQMSFDIDPDGNLPNIYCLSAIKRVFYSVDCVQVTLNVNDDDDLGNKSNII